MRELALIALLLTPSWHVFDSAKTNLNSYLSPKVTKQVVEKQIPVLSQGPIRTSTETFSANAGAVYSIDVGTNEVLTAKNEDQKLQIASLTKLMTAYVILKDQPDLDKVVTVPNYSVQFGDAVMGVNPGEQLKLRDLLAGLLIPSAADSASSLAIIDSGSESAFVGKMNQKASLLGLPNTHFANPVGDDSDANYSSAKDVASLTRILLANPTFADLTSLRTKTVYSVGGRPITLYTTNDLLGNNGYLGIKTGTTIGAGQCLVSLQKVAEHEILTVVLGSTDRFGDTIATNTWTNSHFSW